MCDQTEIVYGDGEVVWVKLGPTWWPGQVLDKEKAPPEALNSFRKPPIAVVKFFKEELFEFVRNYNQIYKYNCNRKHEFIKKGLDQYRAKHPHMELFPSYVCEAETLTHGDPDIIHSEEFKPAQKLDYNSIFSSGTEKKPKPKLNSSQNDERTPKITHPRILQKYLKGTSDYKVHILVQEVRKIDDEDEERMELEAEEETMVPPPMPTPPRLPATPGPLICHACSFTCNRISVMVLHNKTHSAGYIPYTPPKRPKIRLPHSTPKIKLSPKSFSSKKSRGRPKKTSLPESKPISVTPKTVKSPTKPSSTVKRKAKEKEEEKPKTDLEIKNSLLADWSESSNDSFDILTSVNLCEKPKPVVSSPTQSPKSDLDDIDKSPEISDDSKDKDAKHADSRKADCFDFDDDDDELAIESISRKIPRLSTKSDDTTKKLIDLNAELLEASNKESCNAEEDKIDYDSKINDLLQETKLPELPSVPSDSKFVKSKSPTREDFEDNENKEIQKPQQKTIFKTKTFFRSRHSRSQDAIEKYVADNTSIDKPPTYMEEAEQPENPSDASPTLTPPSKGSQNKTPKFAPKIQLKKLKAALNEQISKPQVNKPKEDKWDDDSIEKLISTTSVDDCVQTTSSTINDLLGSIEEPFTTPQKDVCSPLTLDVDNDQKSMEGISKKLDNLDEQITKSESEESMQITESVGKQKVEVDELKAISSDQMEVSSSVNTEDSKSILLEQSEVIVAKHSSPSKKIDNKKKPVESNLITSSDDLKDSVLSTMDSEKKLNLEARITRSPRKGMQRDSKICSPVQSEISCWSNEPAIKEIVSPKRDVVLPNSSTLSISPDDKKKCNEFDLESAIVEVKSLDSMENATVEMDKIPTESDLQIAEALINLPTSGGVTPIEFSHGVEEIKMSESDKNISAAKSLVQMAEAIQHEQSLDVTTDTTTVLERKPEQISVHVSKPSVPKPVTSPYKEKSLENSKLFKILDEPAKPKSIMKIISSKVGESIPNVQVGSQTLNKPRVIIRKGMPQKELKQPAVLQSPTKKVQVKEDDTLFDINSMPIVLSEEIITPESMQKMPIVVSDVAVTPKRDVPLIIPEKPKIKEPVKSPATSTVEGSNSPVKKYGTEIKSTTVVKPILDKSATPNILSKSNKVKTVKHLLVVDKNSGEQKIITSESFEDPPPVITKVSKRSPAILSRSQKPGEKFIIIPSTQSPKPATAPPALAKLSGTPTKITPPPAKPMVGKRTQKIIINPQTGPQILFEDSSTVEKPKVATTTKAKIIQNRTNSEPTGNAVMIITNAQGVQSKIVLTPEHQKVLFSNKPRQLTLTTQTIPQINKTVSNVQTPRAKPIAVTSQSIITSRGQIINPISGNALITSTGQLLPAQTSVTSSSSPMSSKQKGSIISSTKVIPPGERVIISGKPNQTILTSKGQLIMTQMTPTTSQSKICTNTVISSSQIAATSSMQKTIIGKPKQTLKMTSPTIIKSNSKLIGGDLAALLQGKKPGTVMHLSAAQFEHLQKTGQIIQQPSLTQIIQKGKPVPSKVQSQKIIIQKQPPTTVKQISPIIEKKIPPPMPVPKSVPSLIQSNKTTSLPPPKKQKLRELLTTEPESNQLILPAKKKKIVTYSAKQPIEQPKAAEQVMDLGNLDDLIPATTIATRKGELHVSDTAQRAISEPISDVSSSNVVNSTIQESNLPSTSMQAQDSVIQEDQTQQTSGGLGDGQLLAVPGENFGGPPNSFYLCVEENGTLTPIDNQPLVLENNQLVPMVIPPVIPEFEDQILVDQQTLFSLLGGSGGERLVTGDNQQLLLQGDVRQLMAALAPQSAPNQDILAAALADTDVFQPDSLGPEGLSVVSGTGQGMLVEMDGLGGDFQNLNAVTVHSNVSETSTTLKQPIMSPVEIPSKKRITEDMPNTESLEDSLAVIGVTPPSVPTSLDLPITVTDPRIAPKTTNPLSLSCGSLYAPPTLVLSPTPSNLDAFSTLLSEHKATEAIITSSSVSTIVSESVQNTIVKKGSVSSVLGNIPGSKKLPASSMPCLDDSSSDSFASDNPQQLTEAIQTKTYSPISMPLLSDDPPLQADTGQSIDSTITTSQEVKSMPTLLNSEEITSSCQETETSSVDTNMPLLDDTQDVHVDNITGCTESIAKVETSCVMTIPNNMVLPNEIFNENNTSNEEDISPMAEDAGNNSQPPVQEEVNHDLNDAVIESQIPEENTEVPSGDAAVIDVHEQTVNEVESEPVDGIPIIVTTEDGEPGGAIVDVDLDVAPPSVPSPPEGNSLPRAEGVENFSDASSDASSEIPLQPRLSVSHQSLSMGSNGDHEKRPMSPNSLDTSPKRFKYDDER